MLDVREVADPTPGPGEVRVRMLASPVNPSDLMTVRGTYGRVPELPATPGYEGVGIVEESGGGFLGAIINGKRVAVLNSGSGNWCEQTVVPAKQAIPLDKRLTREQAATFFVNPATAWIMTRDVLKVPRGEWLLQTAAASALGRMVIRLGKHCGFRTLNIVRRAEQVDELKSLGADVVLTFNADADDADRLAARVRESVTDGVQFAIDPVGGRTASAIVTCLGSGGRMLCFGTLSDGLLSFSPRTLMTASASVEGFWLTKHMESLGLIGKLRIVRTIGKLITAGILTSGIGDHFSLDEVREAVRRAEEPGGGEKVLLQIADG